MYLKRQNDKSHKLFLSAFLTISTRMRPSPATTYCRSDHQSPTSHSSPSLSPVLLFETITTASHRQHHHHRYSFRAITSHQRRTITFTSQPPWSFTFFFFFYRCLECVGVLMGFTSFERGKHFISIKNHRLLKK